MDPTIGSLIAHGLLGHALLGSAYLDPGAGSLIIQVLLAALLAVPFVIKAYWKKLKGLGKRNKAALVDSPQEVETEKTDGQSE